MNTDTVPSALNLAAMSKPLGEIKPADTSRVVRRIVAEEDEDHQRLDVAAFNSSI
jgi:FXSXX-COOH protein